MVVHTLTAEETEAFGARAWRAHGPSGRIYSMSSTSPAISAPEKPLSRAAFCMHWALREPCAARLLYTRRGLRGGIFNRCAPRLVPTERSVRTRQWRLGLREWATAGHIWLVEWPERGSDSGSRAPTWSRATHGRARTGMTLMFEPRASWARSGSSAWRRRRQRDRHVLPHVLPVEKQSAEVVDYALS